MKRKRKPETEYVPCPLCQADDHQKFLTKFEMNLVKCRKCSLIYANPRIQEPELFSRYTASFFFDEYLPAFKAAPTYYDPEVIRSHFFIFIQLITKYFKPGKRLLDVGCGSGFFLKAAEEIGWEAEGVEISAAASEYAQNIVGVKVLEGKLEAHHFPAEKFDLVVMLETAEHLMNPLNTLKEIYRILKRGGILIISTPDSNSLSRLFLGKNWAVFSPEEHLSVFSQKSLFYLLQRANFCILGIRNLLQLNPEYTHNKKGLGYFVFKKLCNRLEKIEIMEKATLFEYADLMNVEEKKHLQAEGIHPNLNLKRKMKRRVHKWAKMWIRGDILISIAKKND